jgi:quercetin dioxygenase-like cupin family protein
VKRLLLLALSGWLLSCSGAAATGAPPPPPRRGLPTAPPTVTAETEPKAKTCSCQLKLATPQAPPSSPPPAQPVPPISGDLPQAPFDLERRSACTAPVCRLDGFVPDAAFLQTTRTGAASQGAVWLETIADKSSVMTPPSDEIDALALVLEGSVAFGEGDPKKAQNPSLLGTWGALRAPGSGYFLQARGGRATVLMVVTARSGTLGEAVTRTQRSKKGPTPPSGSRLETRDVATLPKFTWAGGAYHARIAFGGAGADKPSASLTLLQASGSGSLAENVHDQEWEHIAVLRGSGEMLLGDARYPVQNGSVFHVPRGTLHGWNGGGQELAAVLVFSPSGPEQRFVQLGGTK